MTALIFTLACILATVLLLRRPKESVRRVDRELRRMVRHDKIALPHHRFMTPDEFAVLHGSGKETLN